jgi:hypothetical protein
MNYFDNTNEATAAALVSLIYICNEYFITPACRKVSKVRMKQAIQTYEIGTNIDEYSKKFT